MRKQREKHHNKPKFDRVDNPNIPKIKFEPITDAQKQYANIIYANSIIFCTGSAGTGKTHVAITLAAKMLFEKQIDKIVLSRPAVEAGEKLGFLPGPQPLDARIITPSGYTTMGDLKKGDYVIGIDGTKKKILDIFKKGIKDVYKITTTENTYTEACLDHLWVTNTKQELKTKKSYTPTKKQRTIGTLRTTQDILDTLYIKDKINHYLPRNEPVIYNSQKINIPPYLLGALLGDGSFSNSICLTNIDKEIIDRANEEASTINCYLTNDGKTIIYNIRSDLYNNKPAKKIQITDIISKESIIYNSIGIAEKELDIPRSTIESRIENKSIIDNKTYEFVSTENKYQNPIKQYIFEYGLLNKKCDEKFIPDIYKYNSVEIRLDIIRGLMDTDGYVKSNGEASFSTTSLQLANDVIEIIRSLGGRSKLRERNRIGKTSIYNGKEIKTKLLSYTVSINLNEMYNPFFLSRKANLYKRKFKHNIGIKSIEYVGKKEVQCILIDDPTHLYLTDDFIVTHNTLDEKYEPWLKPINTILLKYIGKSQLEYYYKSGKIEPEPLGYLRGSTFDNSFVILDEAQNTTPEQMKMFTTRIGMNTKMIIDGDIDQKDLKTTCGLSDAIHRLKHISDVGTMQFSDDDCVRSEICKQIIKAYRSN